MIETPNLSDLDEMVLRCRTERARSYAREAASSYRAGAYRACIVTSWIAVAFDIIDKIRELSLSGDKAAQDIVSEIEKREHQIRQGDKTAMPKALAFERDLLELARDKFQL